MTFETIEQIEAHEWTGNFGADGKASDAVAAFIAKQTDLDMVRRANRVISEKMMGEEWEGMTDEEAREDILDAQAYIAGA